MLSKHNREESLRIATEFASEFDAEAPDVHKHRRPFDLARKLRAIGGKARDHRKAVQAYCELVGDDFDNLWEYFLAAWDDVKFPDYGQSGLDWAYDLALNCPIPLQEEAGSKKREILYSMCLYLGNRNRPFPFMLARVPLAKLLEIDPSAISKIVKWLVKIEVIVEVGKYVPKVLAQQYLLTRKGQQRVTKVLKSKQVEGSKSKPPKVVSI